MLLLGGTLGCETDQPASAPPRRLARKSPALERLYPHTAPAHRWRFIVLHHSATAGGSVESIDAEHRLKRDASGKPWLGIGYHFVVGNGQGMPDGHVAATFRWREQLHGAHAGSRPYNADGIGICLIGNFDDNRPSPKQIAATRRLVSQLAERYHIGVDDILPHREINATQCPGKLFPWSAVVSPAIGHAPLAPQTLVQKPEAPTP